MKRDGWTRAWLALGFICVVAWPGHDGTSFGTDTLAPSWQTDVATARRLARLSGKPIFAVFR